MDVLFFLKKRTNFIRQFYETAGQPFREVHHKIEAGEAPFQPEPLDYNEDGEPDYNEDGEPPFLEEWIQAETSVEILGRICISMLSASLKLYFETWEDELDIKWEKEEKRKYFKKGFVRGYKRKFGELLRLPWNDCPVDFDVLEQITLVRNQEQHPDWISSMEVRHDPKTTTKFNSLFFYNYNETDPPSESPWRHFPIHVTHEKLFAAIEQVELLGEWLEERMFTAKYPGRNQT
jgi:hypothetical protein